MSLPEAVIKTLTKDDKGFMREHIKANVPQLLLKYSTDTHKRFLIEQIAARQRIAKKLPEWSADFNLIFPTGIPLEQSSSQQTALLKSNLIKGSSLTDLTGGLGVDCYYIGKNFESVNYVEQNPELAAIVKHNFSQLASRIKVFETSAEKFLSQIHSEVIYIDPARRDEQQNRTVQLQDYRPNVIDLLPELKKKVEQLYIKTSPLLDLTQALKNLPDKPLVFFIFSPTTATTLSCSSTLGA